LACSHITFSRLLVLPINHVDIPKARRVYRKKLDIDMQMAASHDLVEQPMLMCSKLLVHKLDCRVTLCGSIIRPVIDHSLPSTKQCCQTLRRSQPINSISQCEHARDVVVGGSRRNSSLSRHTSLEIEGQSGVWHVEQT
jgi:hypothetical protein